MAAISNLFAKNLRFYRESRNFTQDELAKKLKVSKSMVASWENERKWIGRDKISDVASVLGVQESDLFKSDQPPPPPLNKFEILQEFARLLSNADPERVKEALELLEIGQPEQTVSRKRTSRI